MTANLKNIFKKNLDVRVNGSLWMETTEGRFFGPGLLELLERIQSTGSIRKAAKEMELSYQKAWGLIQHLNQQMEAPVVKPHAGGEKGGGSVLTHEALELIGHYRQMRERFAEFLESETRHLEK